ncbi:MAG: hypothetical protein LBR16_07445 [Treponema sp.]|jgi:hypothetical protein|nr:hypothetical protein [Treponema sp.]
MKSLLELAFTGENLRTIILLVVIIGGLLLQNARLDKRFVEMRSELKADIAAVRSEVAAVDAKMDRGFLAIRAEIAASEARLNSRIDALKFNDFAHLESAFKNLTYVLEKKHFIDAEDKTFIDKDLDAA